MELSGPFRMNINQFQLGRASRLYSPISGA
jgi:hypothetical protein